MFNQKNGMGLSWRQEDEDGSDPNLMNDHNPWLRGHQWHLAVVLLLWTVMLETVALMLGRLVLLVLCLRLSLKMRLLMMLRVKLRVKLRLCQCLSRQLWKLMCADPSLHLCHPKGLESSQHSVQRPRQDVTGHARRRTSLCLQRQRWQRRLSLHRPSHLLLRYHGGHQLLRLQPQPKRHRHHRLREQPRSHRNRRQCQKSHRPVTFMHSCMPYMSYIKVMHEWCDPVMHNSSHMHVHEQAPNCPPPGWAGNLSCMHACNFMNAVYISFYIFDCFLSCMVRFRRLPLRRLRPLRRHYIAWYILKSTYHAYFHSCMIVRCQKSMGVGSILRLQWLRHGVFFESPLATWHFNISQVCRCSMVVKILKSHQRRK